MLSATSRCVVLAALLAAAAALPARAQTYPSSPVHLIVAYSAGGTGDVVARIVAPKLQAALGQSVIVENKPGASGAIGAHSVTTAEPDGLTLLVGQTGEIAINQHWVKGLSYDPDKDLMPVALLAVVPLALVVPAKAPYSTMAEFMKALRTEKISFASAGTGTPGYFAGEFLKAKTHGNLTHVPYKGAGPALNDLIGGHVDFYFPGTPAAVPLVKSGLVKLLAVSSATRSAISPETPTIAESAGIPDFDFTLWAGVFAPKGTPPVIVARLNTEINKVLNDPETHKRLVEAGADVNPMSVAQVTAFAQKESQKYAAIIKETGVSQ
jgi:tripartite-type tricarboxylate transporter receptor subunit TctC